MENIKHAQIPANGISMHVAEIGEGPPVLFLHGFPDLWYTWRHQMLFLASNGYRAIAPDLRGYGDTDSPHGGGASYTAFHVVGDLVALLKAMDIEKVFLVGHDWGATVAWYFCLFRPDLVNSLVNLSVVFYPRNPAINPVEMLRMMFGDEFYMCSFQSVGMAEADFGKYDTADVMKAFLTSLDTSLPVIPKELGIEPFVKKIPATLPEWLTVDDVEYYASKFKKSGFTGGLNYYRALNLTWEMSAAWTGAQIKVPVKFIVGDLDLTYHIPGTQDYIHNGQFKKDVPGLQEVVIIKDAAHFLHQEKTDQVNAHIHNFIRKFDFNV